MPFLYLSPTTGREGGKIKIWQILSRAKQGLGGANWRGWRVRELVTGRREPLGVSFKEIKKVEPKIRS
jgi:hypothetical protein